MDEQIILTDWKLATAPTDVLLDIVKNIDTLSKVITCKQAINI
jgi:hypothetical protein